MKFLNLRNIAYNCSVIRRSNQIQQKFLLIKITISNNSPRCLSIPDLTVSLALGFIIAIFYADTFRNLTENIYSLIHIEICNRNTSITSMVGSGHGRFELLAPLKEKFSYRGFFFSFSFFLQLFFLFLFF